jgi:hypothetical protein
VSCTVVGPSLNRSQLKMSCPGLSQISQTGSVDEDAFVGPVSPLELLDSDDLRRRTSGTVASAVGIAASGVTTTVFLDFGGVRFNRDS